MEKKIENLRWRPRWITHLGCIKGCLEYLGVDVSDAWLFGATGHAFVINLHDEVCPSGPTAWDTQMLFRLGRNVGYEVGGVFATRSDGDFVEKRQAAWETAKRAIDQGLPCYGWELDAPEYYVVHGYDDVGYYYSGPLCDSGTGPKPWESLADSEIGVLEMYVVRPGQGADNVVAVKEALEFALEHAASPSKWVRPKYRAGLAGFDNWIHALEAGTAHRHGAAYNAVSWCECRGFAAQFLSEARGRLNGTAGRLLDEAASHYDEVYARLQQVCELFPFPPKGDEVKDKWRCEEAAGHLRAARESEEAGLKVLERIVGVL